DIHFDPALPGRRYGLEMRGLTRPGDLQMRIIRRAAHRIGKFRPVDPAEQLLAPPPPELLGLPVDVGEAPVAIDRIESIADAFEDLDAALARRAQRGLGQNPARSLDAGAENARNAAVLVAYRRVGKGIPGIFGK